MFDAELGDEGREENQDGHDENDVTSDKSDRDKDVVAEYEKVIPIFEFKSAPVVVKSISLGKTRIELCQSIN
jgi:hypothetical protein